jgi:hypothetical protein
MAGSQAMRRVMTTWIQRSRAAVQAVRACWRASRLWSRVVRVGEPGGHHRDSGFRTPPAPIAGCERVN